MTFLEPLLLWGLPLALLPVIIHLFNRLRHRTIKWGAMLFLLSANRKSTRYAKLRQWLILLFRVLALACLILAIGRPLAGGWIGWMLRPAPDAIIMVLDRSASMEARMPGGNISKRAEAVKLLSEAAQGFQETSRLVLYDTALRAPFEVGDAPSLPQLSAVAASDTAADIPGALQGVVDWVAQNRPGSLEIWIASDLQRSSWQPEGGRWNSLAAQLAGLPQNVRIRMLALDQPPVGESSSLLINEVHRRSHREQPELDVFMSLDRNNPAPANTPLTLTLDGSRSQFEVPVQGQSFLYRHKVVVESGANSGWGKFELPADDNPRDNAAYFVYGPPVSLKTLVVSGEANIGQVLQLAAAPIPDDPRRQAVAVAPDQLTGTVWSDYSLVVWQAAPPGETVARQLRDYVEKGGALLMFATGATGSFEGLSWGEVQEAPQDKYWPVTRWEEKEGPLMKTEEGLSLLLNELVVIKRQLLVGSQKILATFEDGTAFLGRKVMGKGELVFCTASPSLEWSNLREGVVLLPLVQRMIQSGGRRFTQAGMVNCGELTAAADGAAWTSVESVKDYRVQAGVYRAGNQLVAVNRPPSESDPEILEPAKARALFGSLPVQFFSEQKQGESKMQSELWRLLLFAMLMILLAEAILILPPKPDELPGAKLAPKGGAA